MRPAVNLAIAHLRSAREARMIDRDRVGVAFFLELAANARRMAR